MANRIKRCACPDCATVTDACNCVCYNTCGLTGEELFDMLVRANGNNPDFSASASDGLNSISVSGSDGGGPDGAGIVVMASIRTLEPNTTISFAGSFSGSPPITLGLGVTIAGITRNFTVSPVADSILVATPGTYCIQMIAVGFLDPGSSVSFSLDFSSDKDIQVCPVTDGGGGGPPVGP